MSSESSNTPPSPSQGSGDSWNSRVGVILAVAGSAIGLGNFLRFPSVAAEYGGGAFVIPYLLALMLVGMPVAWVEWSIGRYGGRRGFNSLAGIFHAVSGNRFVGCFGVLGLLLSLVLLWRRWLPRSFDKPADGSASEKGGGEIPAAAHGQTAAEESRPDPDGASGTAENDPQAWPEEHPHPRREVMKELLFLAPPILGALVAFWIGPGGEWPAPLRVPGGVLLGYLAGAGIVWIVRILGTLGCGGEAMGLGDMHLLAAVGAVAGWEVPVIAFFGAPFLGLAWALISTGAQKLLNRQVKVIPYGPHLAAAALVVVAFREPLVTYFGRALLG